MIHHYENYEIGQTYDSYDDGKRRLLDDCVWMIDNKETLRVTAENWDFALTTLWKKIHRELEDMSPELYRRVKKRMAINKKNRRYRGVYRK